MPAALEYLYLPAPHEGLDVSLAPHQLPRTRAWRYHNYLTLYDGRCALRGQIRSRDDMTPRLAAGAFPVSATRQQTVNKYTVTFAVPDAGGNPRFLPHRNFDVVNTGASYGPLQANSGEADVAAGTLTNAGSADYSMVPGFAIYQGNARGYVMGDPTVLGNVSYGGKQHTLTKLSRYSAPANKAQSGWAPKAGQAVASHAGRLWVGGGTAVGTNSPLLPNTLWYTNIGQDGTAEGAQPWQTNGVANALTIGDEGVGDFIIGLAPMQRQMLILKRNSIWRLMGLGEDTWTVQNVTTRIGCFDPRSIVVLNDNVYWLSQDGLKRYDGTDITTVSDPVWRILLPAVANVSASDADAGAYAVCEHIGQEQILITLGTQQWKTGDPAPANYFAGIYNTKNNRWSTFSAPSLFVDAVAPSVIVQDASTIMALDLDILYDMTYMLSPEIYLGTNPYHDGALSGTYTAILGEIYMTPVRAASPRARAHIHRFGVEHVWQRGSGAFSVGMLEAYLRRYTNPENEPDPTVELSPSIQTADTIGARDQLLSSVAWQNAHHEVTDAYLRIARTAGTTSNDWYLCHFLGAMLEYQAPTHRRS